MWSLLAADNAGLYSLEISKGKLFLLEISCISRNSKFVSRMPKICAIPQLVSALHYILYQM